MGLRNPEVKDAGTGPKPSTHPSSFRTHIAEPRGQQVATLVILLIILVVWIVASIVS